MRGNSSGILQEKAISKLKKNHPLSTNVHALHVSTGFTPEFLRLAGDANGKLVHETAGLEKRASFSNCLTPHVQQNSSSNPPPITNLKVRDENGRGVLVYGFSEEPELNKEANWSYSSYLTVESYYRKGYSLWLNKGSKICMRWTTQTSRSSDQTEVVLVKGRIGEDTLLPKTTIPFFALFLNEPVTGEEAEYTIDEDGIYSVGVINSNPRTTKMTLNITVTAMVYDVTKATSVCSTRNGSCFLDLHFPNTHYVVVSTPDHSDVDGRYVKLTYDSRDVSYIGLLGLFIIMMLLLLKAQESCHSEFDRRMMTDPILAKKPVRTNDTSADEDNDDGSRSSSSSSADLNDAKLCIICYEDQHNCFFVPCGHSATCYECAKRFAKRESCLLRRSERTDVLRFSDQAAWEIG
ncbi:RING/U-box superfamily protein isoform 3 [Hibiscus syriacus]|uniref:RING/U-box superfamily protein isoform 3 n=1 Tax=Hibiscus syriacus TaxID=106335 RepID=A0A6A2YVI1_HIBSY|nr:RING/U-box superfamily protein isoform 3 [Hibiscus syriacus]